MPTNAPDCSNDETTLGSDNLDNDEQSTSEPFSEPSSQATMNEKVSTAIDDTTSLGVSSGESAVISPPVVEEWINYAAAAKMSMVAWRPESRYGFRINPRVFITSTLITWFFVILCSVYPEDSFRILSQAKISVTDYFTWLYIVTQDGWMIFIVVLYCSKYGSIKLGDKDEEPEYNTATWFTMLFSCGVSVGLFFFGVAEPMTHYTAQVGTKDANRYSHMSADDRTQWALEVVYYHWGMHGWVVYTLIAITMGFMGYKKKLPVTMRSCFYPLLGDKVFGLMGDCIDTMSAACTMFGICTSLGLGVIDLTAGLNRMSGCTGYMKKEPCMEDGDGKCFWADLGRCISHCHQFNREYEIRNSFDKQSSCDADATCKWDAVAKMCEANDPMGVQGTVTNQIWLVAGITFLATLSVLTGVKFGIKFFSVLCFAMGMFLWTYVFLADDPLFFLDAFVQQIGMYFNYILQIGFHTDAYARHLVSTTKDKEGASRDWMHNWTMFFWGWWIAWSPYVGMFIAKISRGRTIRQIINGTMTAPALYCFLWFTVFGGSGLKMERMAAAAGGDGSLGLIGAQSPTYLTINRTSGMFDSLIPCERGDDNCLYASRLSQRNREDHWMDMISQFYSLAPLMMGISLLSIVLYFITSADSGSLIIDCLCSNGMEDPPIPQKIYWAVMNGFVASTLLYVGSTVANDPKDSLNALQSAGICAGLPYTLIMCFMCASIWKACGYETGEIQWKKDRFFKTDLFDVFDVRCTKEWRQKFLRTCFAAVAPWYFLHSSLPHTTMKDSTSRILYIVTVAALFHAWLLFMVLEPAFGGAMVIGLWWYLCFCTMLCFFRGQMRGLKNIDGDFFQDMFSSLMLYPLVCEQLDAHFSELPKPGADKYKE